MKGKKSAALLCAVLFAAFSAVQVLAVEVPADVTEVRIPVTVSTATALAGAEVAVVCTEGLTFKDVEVSATYREARSVNTVKDGVIYAGIFLGSNAFTPVAGEVLFGSLVFQYSDTAPQSVTIRKTTRYQFDAAGQNLTGTDDDTPVVVPVTRPATPDSLSNFPGGSSSSGPVSVDVEELPAPLAAPETVTFDDLTEAEWAREAVEYLATYKGILGMGNGRFAPGAMVTRAQFARFVGQAFDLVGADTPVQFHDVGETDWYWADVTKLSSLGILKGYPDGSFRPDANITREQMAVIADRTLTYLEATLTQSAEVTLPDIETAAEYARPSIVKLCRADVIRGMGDGTFRPQNLSTRAQAAVVVYRSLAACGRLSP
ncbi:MAG: S-layer homology domain-containing protein [Oscillospiraceae bacterium]|jgi:hypothetical protein|nr:S-layer homology domain-containing protein [Oscillospiraceae bacterium]